MDKFKLFVDQHRATNNAQEPVASKPASTGKVKKVAKSKANKKPTNLTTQMVSDVLEQPVTPQYTFTLRPN